MLADASACRGNQVVMMIEGGGSGRCDIGITGATTNCRTTKSEDNKGSKTERAGNEESEA